jgi:hypothetical protein
LDQGSTNQYDASVNKTVRCFLDRLDRRQSVTGIEKTSERIKTSKGIRKIKEVIHVVPKSLKDSVSIPGKTIDWSHRWEVRGHWRMLPIEGTDTPDLTRVGKNRDGEFLSAGYTWVSDHVRGPETVPLIKKTRIVDSMPSLQM